MTKQELVKYVTSQRNQLLYSVCFDRTDFNNLVRNVEKIISALETALLAKPDEYVNLKIHIGKLKTAIGRKEEKREVKSLCKGLRREVLSDLTNIIFDNSQHLPSRNQNSN